MKKFVFLLLLSMYLFSCYEDSPYELREFYNFSKPIFVGNDSILYFEYYQKPTENKEEMDEISMRIIIIDREGNYISTIMYENLYVNETYGWWSCNSVDLAERTKTLSIHFRSDLGMTNKYMCMDLNGNIITEFVDMDLNIENNSIDYGLNIHSSPNGMYYSITNKIKTISGEVVKVLSDTIMDWNTKGLLVRKTTVDSATIDIDGTDYNVYSHPDAHFWYGPDVQYIRFWQYSAYIYNWSDSSLIKVIPFNRTSPSNYGSYAYGGHQIPPDLMSSSISPDLQYLVFNYHGIYLFDFNTGESKLIKDEVQY